MNIKAEVKENPILAITMTIVTTALVSIGSSTFATIGYVNDKHKEGISYMKERYQITSKDINEKHNDIKTEMSDIKKTIKELNHNIMKLYQGK